MTLGIGGMDREVRLIVNAVAFYAAWFAVALTAAKGSSVLALLVGLAVVAVHLALAERVADELRVIAAAAVLGFVVETLLLKLGVTTFAAADNGPHLPPNWMIALWMAFATLPNISFAWLHSRYWLAAILGFLGGPLSYWAGARLGAMAIAPPLWPSLAIIGVLWAIAFSLLMWIARRS